MNSKIPDDLENANVDLIKIEKYFRIVVVFIVFLMVCMLALSWQLAMINRTLNKQHIVDVQQQKQIIRDVRSLILDNYSYDQENIKKSGNSNAEELNGFFRGD